jgi:anti-sigma B factor antagonist
VASTNVEMRGDDRGEAVVAVSGEIDMAVGDDLLNTLNTTIRTAGVRRVVVDLSRVSFMDSTGLHVLLNARVTARTSRVGFTVVGAVGLVHRVLAITGVLQLLTGEANADSDAVKEPFPAITDTFHAVDLPAAGMSG